MDAHAEPTGTSRRDVLKTGAVGMGALLGAMGMSGVAHAEPVGAAATGRSGPVDYFLKIEGIDGESTDAKHKGEIQLLSFSWGASAPTSIGSATGGAGAGKVSLSSFHFTATTSKASPQLFVACASGRHLPAVQLTARRGGRVPVEFIKLSLNDVLVSSYQNSGAAATLPVDAVSLDFAKVAFSYTPFTARGTAGSPVTGSWDVTKGAGG
jgi:type VI secretion system secreted protein Hcp